MELPKDRFLINVYVNMLSAMRGRVQMPSLLCRTAHFVKYMCTELSLFLALTLTQSRLDVALVGVTN